VHASFDDASFNRWRRIPRSTDAYTTPKKNKEDKRQDMLFRGSTTVSVKFTNNYRQHCEKRKAPVFHLLRGRFWSFSPRRGDTLHRWHWNLARM